MKLDENEPNREERTYSIKLPKLSNLPKIESCNRIFRILAIESRIIESRIIESSNLESSNLVNLWDRILQTSKSNLDSMDHFDNSGTVRRKLNSFFRTLHCFSF